MSETEVIETPGERTRVGFPEAPPEKPKSNKALIAVIVLLLLLLGVGGWFMFGRQGNLSLVAEATPTPTEFVVTNTPIPTEAEEELVREGVKIQVLNGTGIAGAAGDLQSELEDLGYEDVDTGNASSQNATATTVVFDSEVSEAVREDIITLLETLYDKVTESEKSMTDFNVVITTGNPKGGRPATPTTRVSTATPTKSAGTNTPTKTPTPNP